MACKDMNGVINDHPVYVRQWPASVALDNLSKALKVFGADLAFFIDGTYEFTNILRVMRNNDPELVQILKDFACAARVDGREIRQTMFDAEYSGDIYRVWKTFAFVCEVNYKDFFDEGVSLLEQGLQEQDRSEQSQLPQ